LTRCAGFVVDKKKLPGIQIEMKNPTVSEDIDHLCEETVIHIAKAKPGDTVPLARSYFLVEQWSEFAAEPITYVLTREDIDSAQQVTAAAIRRGDITVADLV
jgi:hypothetical protein